MAYSIRYRQKYRIRTNIITHLEIGTDNLTIGIKKKIIQMEALLLTEKMLKSNRSQISLISKTLKKKLPTPKIQNWIIPLNTIKIKSMPSKK